MLLSVLLLLLQLVSRTHAGFCGVVSGFFTKDFQGAGYQLVRYDKYSFSLCQEFEVWLCGGSCSGYPGIKFIRKIIGDGCQVERLIVTNNFSQSYQTILDGSTWTNNSNGVVLWTSLITFKVANRSDTGKANSSPQTTILPIVRVSSNCRRNISLLAFDPDGDNVQCRLSVAQNGECITCTPARDLSVFSSCILSFNPTNSSKKGAYAVQLVMEDFPRKTITMTDITGKKGTINTKQSISGIPIQFLLSVDPAAPSCTEGLYLPRFLPPTPENGAQISAAVNQILQIDVRAEANQSQITQIFFSGPYNVIKNTSGSGNFTLSWTPSPTQVGESHPICFVVQARMIRRNAILRQRDWLAEEDGDMPQILTIRQKRRRTHACDWSGRCCCLQLRHCSLKTIQRAEDV